MSDPSVYAWGKRHHPAIGLNDPEGLILEDFVAFAAATIQEGEVLTRSPASGDSSKVVLANPGSGIVQIVCGVAMHAAAIGQRVRVLRRGIHTNVIYDAAGAAGQRATISLGVPGACTPISALNGTDAPHVNIGIQLETATGAPLRASTYVSCWA